jgi:uncharacterized membrane protein YgdD (TMEM256/DUF423 family)
MNRAFGITAAASGAAAVMLGAFGAHALRSHLDAASLQVWHTAVEYQFWHALALIAVAVCAPARDRSWWRAAGIAFVGGSIVFCGSLYALALAAPPWIGAITPLGGVALIAGWILLAVAFGRNSPPA